MSHITNNIIPLIVLEDIIRSATLGCTDSIGNIYNTYISMKCHIEIEILIEKIRFKKYEVKYHSNLNTNVISKTFPTYKKATQYWKTIVELKSI